MKTFIQIFDRNFLELYRNSCLIIEKTPEEKLFVKPSKNYSSFSAGELILRSAGKIEQTFGGITTRLWDDPFEWTLPEELSTKEKILDYLNEVEKTRKRGFELFESDDDLRKELPAPVDLKSLFEILIETATKSAKYQGGAETVLQIILL